MKKRILCIVLALICIFSLLSCNEAPPIDDTPDDSGQQTQPDDGSQQTPPEENNSQVKKETIEYGYKKLRDDDPYPSYRLAYKVNANKNFGRYGVSYLGIKLSHGAEGPWYYGGYIYPNVERVEVWFEDTLLYEDGYFDYLNDHIYFTQDINSRPHNSLFIIENQQVKFYTSDNYDGERNSWVRFNNEVSYTLLFTKNKTEYTFEIREVYFDGSVKVVCEAKLYARFDGNTVYFSNEPFDE